MVVIVFRARLRPNVDFKELEQLGQRMYAIASAMPGYISYQDFAAQDGENVSIVEFESEETLAAWREHPEHRSVQKRGREEFFSEYQIQVCKPVRESRFRLAQ